MTATPPTASQSTGLPARTFGPPVIVAENVQKHFGSFHALRGVNLTVRQGEVVVVIGPSGSGKSTFIRTINALDPHDGGSITVDAIPLNGQGNLDAIRREVGMVFQSFNLFPHLTVLENITLAPTRVRGTGKAEAEARGLELLRRVGIAEQAYKYPAQLSGGQQQRVACARALVSRPDVVFADEPTGNLDSASGEEVLRFLRYSVDELGQTIVMVTHDPAAAGGTDRIVFLADGRVVDEMREPSADRILDRMKQFDARHAARGEV